MNARLLVQITNTLLSKMATMHAGVIMISKKSRGMEKVLVVLEVLAHATTSMNAVLWRKVRKFFTSIHILLSLITLKLEKKDPVFHSSPNFKEILEDMLELVVKNFG
jgi:uncharacterized membrane protein